MIISQHQPPTPKPKKPALPWIIVAVLFVCLVGVVVFYFQSNEKY